MSQSYRLRNKSSPPRPLCCKCRKAGRADSLIKCKYCRKCYHTKSPCYKLDENIWQKCKSYAWSCLDCKRCETCKNRRDERNLILCDECDRGFHLYCLPTRLKKPPTGVWKCPVCKDASAVPTSVSSEVPTEASTTVKARLVNSNAERKSIADDGRNMRNRVKLSLLPAEVSRKTAPPAAPDPVPAKKRKTVSEPETGRKEKARLPHRELRDSRRHLLPTSTRSSTPSQTPRLHESNNAGSSTAKLSVELPPAPRCCPTPECNGQGHLSGAFEVHRTLETCPVYHNRSLSDCKRMLQERQLLLGLSSRSGQVLRPQKAMNKEQQLACVTEIQEKRAKVRRSLTELSPEKRARSEHSNRHHEEYGRDREPLLDGYSTDEDLALFRQSQALLAQDLEEDESLYARQNSCVKLVEFGIYEIQTWYPSPFADGMEKLHKLFVCEFCLKYVKSKTILRRHCAKCIWQHPPGNEIYRKNNLSIFEVDGRKSKIYCQNLCLFAKLFLDHKTLYFDVEPFLFYALTIVNETGCHLVGYFSKEKKSCMNCNLSCLLILPPYQHMGYGRLLIDFSYLLSRIEEKIGSPERPLSDLGLISYRKYWAEVILSKTASLQNSVSIKDLSQETGIHPNDIISTLEYLGMIKYWKGQYYVYKKEDVLEEYLNGTKRKNSGHHHQIDPTCLHWQKPAEQPAQK